MASGAWAWGQRLNLDGPSSPGPGECGAVLAWAERLEQEGRGGEADVRALRNLAAAMLRAAETAAPASPRSVLTALTFAERLSLLEGVVAVLDPAGRALLAKDALQLTRNVPTDAEALGIAVRDVCAAVVPAWGGAGGGGPWRSGAGAGPSLSGLGEARRKSAELEGALAVIEGRLALAESSAAYGPLAGEARRRIMGAAVLAVSPPAWMSAAARQAAAGQFVDAVKRYAEEPQSQETSQRLERLILLGRAARGLEGQRGAVAAAGQQAVSRLAAAGPVADPTRRAGELRRLEAVARAAELLEERERYRDEKRVVRQFRPALRTMLELARLSEQDLLEVLPEAIGAEGEDAMNAPNLIAAVAAHRRRLEDVAVVVDASEAILRAQGPAAANADKAARDEYKFLADKLLSLAKEAYELAQKNDPLAREELERALARVRLLATDCRDFALFPGEDAFRAAGEGLVGRVGPGLIKALEADRVVWLKRWASPDRPPLAEGERLRRLHGLMVLAWDAAEAEAMVKEPRHLAAANSWPGWEMRASTLGVLSAGMEEAVEAACASRDERAVKGLLDRYAGALLAGRLGRLLAAEELPPMVAELAAGPAPAGTLLGERLEDLARVCREAFELEAREARGAAGTDALRASLGRTARGCLSDAPIELPTSPPPPPPPAAPVNGRPGR